MEKEMMMNGGMGGPEHMHMMGGGHMMGGQHMMGA